MKQKYSFILIGFLLGIAFLAVVRFLYIKTRPLVRNVKAKIEKARLNNIPRAKEEFLICDFENTGDLKKWKLDNANIELSNEHVSSGRQSAKVSFRQSNAGSGLKIEELFEKNKSMANWAGYEALSFDIFNPSARPERIIVQVKDEKQKRMKFNTRLNPGAHNHIEISISELQEKLDTSKIIQLNLFLWKNKQDKAFYLDAVRLLPSAALAKEKRGIFDAGFLPKQGEQVYATGDYFAFDSPKWLKTDLLTKSNFVQVPLIIKNPVSAAAGDLVFSGGVPFPRGQLKSLAQLNVSDSQGNDVLFQSKILGFWPDKSIKWALLTLKSGVGPYENKRLYLRYSETIKEQFGAGPSLIEEGVDKVVVNTGRLKIDIGKKGFYLFDSVWLDKNSDCKFSDNEKVAAMADLVLVHNGREYFSHLDKSYQLVIEEEGPVRACVKARGWFVSEKGDKFCQFIVRVYAFSGSEYIKVQHTFVYTGYPENNLHYLYKDHKMPANETIDAIYITVPLADVERSKFSFSSDNKILQGDFNGPVELLQFKADAYRVVKNSRSIDSGNRLGGWLDVSSSDAGVTVGVENMWQQFPKGFSLDKEKRSVAVYLWPKQSQALDFKTTEEAYGPGAFARGSAFGIAKTHDISIYFHDSDYESSNAKNTISSLISDLLVTVDPQWAWATRALGRLCPYDGRVGEGEEFLSRLFEWGARQVNDFGWYGMIDFGDTLSWWRKEAYDRSYDGWGWHPEGRWGWFNCEGVGTHAGALIQFLRSGDQRYFTFGKNLARHIMDIDTCHYNTIANDSRLRKLVPDDYSQVGSMHRHNGNHWGGRNDEASHTNVLGLALYYYITGDARAYDVINEIGSFFLSERITYFRHPDISPQRTIANVLWGDVVMYELTQDERYRKAADKWANLFYVGQRHDGSWSENYNPVEKTWVGKAHMGYTRNYTLPALIAYHQLTANKAIAECIVKATDFVVGKEKYLSYFDAAAYSYWLTGDEKYSDIIKERMKYTLKRQRRNDDPLRNGMVYEKSYYLRVMDFLYGMPYAFEVMVNEK